VTKTKCNIFSATHTSIKQNPTYQLQTNEQE
jgi:hypothetical protein